MSLVSDDATLAQYRSDFDKAAIRYGDMKKKLAEDMIRFITPIRERAVALFEDQKGLKKIIASGAEKARISAKATIEAARELAGLNY